MTTTFQIGAQSFRSDEWSAWRTLNARTVYRSTYSYDDVGTHKFLWEFRHADGSRTAYTTTLLASANVFLSNPTLWESTEEAREIAAQQSGSWFHSVVSAAEHAVSDIGHVTTNLVSFGIQLDEAALHPLTVNGNGLQLSSDAIQLVPDNLQSLAQNFTSVAGFGVLAGAAVTAIGGLGAIQSAVGAVGDTVSGITGAVQGLQSAAGALGLLPQQAPPLFLPPLSAPTQGASSSGGFVLLALGAIALFALKGKK